MGNPVGDAGLARESAFGVGALGDHVDDLRGEERLFGASRVGRARGPKPEPDADAARAWAERIRILVGRLRDERAKLVGRQILRREKGSLFVGGGTRGEKRASRADAEHAALAHLAKSGQKTRAYLAWFGERAGRASTDLECGIGFGQTRPNHTRPHVRRDGAAHATRRIGRELLEERSVGRKQSARFAQELVALGPRREKRVVARRGVEKREPAAIVKRRRAGPACRGLERERGRLGVCGGRKHEEGIVPVAAEALVTTRASPVRVPDALSAELGCPGRP